MLKEEKPKKFKLTDVLNFIRWRGSTSESKRL